jgi:hypothetical protein
MPSWTTLTPPPDGAGLRLVTTLARRLSTLDCRSEGGLGNLHAIRQKALSQALSCGVDAQKLRVWVTVLCDLRGQQWDVRAQGKKLEIRPPIQAESPVAEKERVRADLLVERDQQLRSNGVRKFVAGMERRRIGPTLQWVSIYSLMRDGEQLARQLRAIALQPDPTDALSRMIQPYIQVVDDSRCEHTGMRLKDIWRYFRHTWASPHKTLPGRNLWLLVRDAGAPFHPIIGVAALGSAVMQLAIRDDWVGWSRKAFVSRLRDKPTVQWARWVAGQLATQRDAIYTADFIEAGILRPGDMRKPSAEVIARLRTLSKEARRKHQLHTSSREHKSSDEGREVDWERRARTHLFVSKRASTLADILEDQANLASSGFTSASAKTLRMALSKSAGQKAISRILRRVKAARVGIDILDITVCGAVAPYNHLLGGKLVALLLTSPEVRLAYEARYAQRASVIASGMAGRTVQRRPKLVLLGTTSLYGAGSSQYNRIRMPASAVGGESAESIEYLERGETVGYGSFHFSSVTMQEIRMLLAQESNGRRVRHIFGEGANPRMREVREALDLAGLPSDRLLRHGSSRIVYAVPLAENFREVLLSLDDNPRYLIPEDDPKGLSQQIVNYWRQRWLTRRARVAAVLQQVEQHSLIYPIEHGARVPVMAGEADMLTEVERRR